MERSKITAFENISVSFRFITPLLLSLGIWLRANDIEWTKGNFNEIKATLQEMKEEFKENSKEHEQLRGELGRIGYQCCGEISAKPNHGG